MSAERPSLSFMYLETDIPSGMTIPEWRAHRGAERAALDRSWMRRATQRLDVRLGQRRFVRATGIRGPTVPCESDL